MLMGHLEQCRKQYRNVVVVGSRTAANPAHWTIEVKTAPNPRTLRYLGQLK